MLTKSFKRRMSKTGSKNHVQSSPWVNLTELNLEQGLYFFPNFELSAIVYVNYNSYFPLKIKGITGNNFFMDAQRLRLELVFLMKFVLSQNLITKRGFWYRLPFLKKEFSAKVGEIIQSVKN